MNNNLPKYILLGTGVLSGVLAILLFINPPAIFPDPAWGFLVLRSMQAGAPFNTLTSVNPADVSTNINEFLSWWSPGQYLVPGLFQFILKVNTGQAAAITIILCQFTGLAGFYAFFKKLGFSPLISAVSLLVIICQQSFFTPYIFYNGGETLLFAYLGWFLYGCLVFDKPGIKLVIFVLLSGCVGFVCKSSFMWMYGAGLLFMWVQLRRCEKGILPWIKKGFWLGIPALVSVACIYFFYLSKGENPSSDSAGLKFTWETLAFPLGSPLLSGFSIDDLFNGLIFHNDVAILNYTGTVIVLLICTALSLWIIYAIDKNVPYAQYKALLTTFYVVSVLFFGYAYLRQLTISYEARHFRIIGLIVVPGVICLISRYRLAYTIGFAAIMLIIAGFSIKFYTDAQKVLQDDCARGPSGIAQQFIDQPSLDYITRLDEQNKNALFVFTSPDLGLEITHNRVINLQPLTDELNINFEEYLHKGFAGPVFILLPSKYIGIRASVILKCFPGYKGFSLKQLSDDYVLYFADRRR